MSNSQSVVKRLLVAAMLICISFAAQSAMIRVSQESSAGAGDFDANVLGIIDSYNTGLTIAGFYQYGAPDVASYNGDVNGGPAAVSSVTQGFFVEASNGLHYVVVHDNSPNDGSGGNTQMTTFLMGGAGGSTDFTVEDDPGEGTSFTDVGADRRFDANHNWAPCCTDGYAIGNLGSSFLLLAAFDALPSGITSWQTTGNTLADISTIVLEAGRRVRYDINPVPIPAAVWLFGTALVGFVGMSRRRKVG